MRRIFNLINSQVAIPPYFSHSCNTEEDSTPSRADGLHDEAAPLNPTMQKTPADAREEEIRNVLDIAMLNKPSESIQRPRMVTAFVFDTILGNKYLMHKATVL